MKDILIIAPYGELYEICKNVIAKNNFKNIDVVEADTDGKTDFKELVESKKPIVIISRGGVYRKIKEMFSSVAVVEMRIEAYDILYSLKDVFELNEKVAVLGVDNITYGFDILQNMKNINIVKINREQGEEVTAVIRRCMEQGIKTFMGDARVLKACNEMGVRSFLIRSSEFSVLNSIEKAKEILRIIKAQIESSQRYGALMDCMHDGVIATDEENRIVTYNSIAEDILGIKKKDFIGKKIDEVLANTKNDNLFIGSEPIYDVIRRINGSSVTFTQIPIKVLDEHKGYVSVFQDVKKLQKFEQKVRKQLLGKGFEAKYNFEDIVYCSEAMEKSISKAKKFSLYDSTILIHGKSGVGKELFAQSIHNHSRRRNGPFVALNCGALPESIIESELFGYEEGAFTGSKKGGRAGVFEMAHRGTIFLDEISEIPLHIQSQLLRVIQEREIMRLGDNKVIPLDIRIICASNKDLKAMVAEGKFREDLFYRINTLSFSIPPLKDRHGDIKLLSEYYLKKYSDKYGKDIVGISDDAMEYLMKNEFKGNVRELQNVIERAVILCDEKYISKEYFTEELYEKESQVAESTAENMLFEQMLSLKDLEKEYINYVFEKQGGAVKKICDILKIDRSTLWRKMKEK